jgi:predicted dehydrogenase
MHEPTLERCGKEYGDTALYTDLETMLASEDLDAVDVVTDEPAHGEQARLCLEHGKAVFVEKPLATDGDDAEAVVKLSRDAGLPAVVGNISRFDAPYAASSRPGDSDAWPWFRPSGASRAPGSQASAAGCTPSSSP